MAKRYITPADIGAAEASHEHSAAQVTSGVFGTGRLGTGLADLTKYLRGDGTWQTFADAVAAVVGGVQGAFEPGDLKTSGRSTPASGWLLCDGSAYSRATYADLFAAIGSTYGAGDGTTTFNVPDFRGRTILGAGTGPGLTARSRGNTGGEEAHDLSTSEIPSHDHSGSTGSAGAHEHTHSANQAINTSTGGGAASRLTNLVGGTAGDVDAITTTDGAHTHSVSAAGGGNPHNTMQPYGVANVFIKT